MELNKVSDGKTLNHNCRENGLPFRYLMARHRKGGLVDTSGHGRRKNVLQNTYKLTTQ